MFQGRILYFTGKYDSWTIFGSASSISGFGSWNTWEDVNYRNYTHFFFDSAA